MGLPWYRSDTNFHTHDKVLDLVAFGSKGKAAGFVYECSLSYTVGNGNDGRIKKTALPFVHGTPADARLLVNRSRKNNRGPLNQRVARRGLSHGGANR